MQYSKRYEETNPQSQSCLHLLSEAHLLLRAKLLDPLLGDPFPAPPSPEPDRPADGAPDRPADGAPESQTLQGAFRESCAQLGDCFSRSETPGRQG